MPRRARLLLLAVSVELAFAGATWPLQPLVQVKTEGTAGAASECVDGLAEAPQPRVDVKQIPAPEIVLVSNPLPPPSRSLRSELASAHRTLAGNDRPAFDEHLRNVHAILVGYPPGGERTAAEEVLRVLDDAARVWDAQFVSPFFDEKSEVFGRLSRYPGYVDAVRGNILHDDTDRRYYPAAESRAFLTRLAAERLTRLGVRSETPVARQQPEPSPAPAVMPRKMAPVTRRRAPSRSDAARSGPVTATKTASIAKPVAAPKLSKANAPIKSQAPTKVAPAKTAPVSHDSPVPARKVVPEPAPAPASVPASTSGATSPIAEVETAAATASSTTDATPTSATASSTDTAATTTTEVELTSSTVLSTDPTATSTSSTIPDMAREPEQRSVVVPAMLILIGLGVLVILFRASK